jgi:hypothetical protein
MGKGNLEKFANLEHERFLASANYVVQNRKGHEKQGVFSLRSKHLTCTHSSLLAFDRSTQS